MAQASCHAIIVRNKEKKLNFSIQSILTFFFGGGEEGVITAMRYSDDVRLESKKTVLTGNCCTTLDG